MHLSAILMHTYANAHIVQGISWTCPVILVLLKLENENINFLNGFYIIQRIQNAKSFFYSFLSIFKIYTLYMQCRILYMVIKNTVGGLLVSLTLNKQFHLCLNITKDNITCIWCMVVLFFLLFNECLRGKFSLLNLQ